MGVRTIPLKSVSGACTLTLTYYIPYGAITLSVVRYQTHILSEVSLSGLFPSGAPTTSSLEFDASSITLSSDWGASLLVTRHPSLDSFNISAVGPQASPHVTATLSLAELGPSYGLGHLMRQPWPLADASLELGPFYPFDNGPSGLCTLAVPTVIGAAGVAVTVSERESRCLHLALNASGANIGAGKAFAWGVGVANFDRMVLPRPAAEEKGDGLLILQSRRRFDWPHVLHPWLVDESEGKGKGAGDGGGVLFPTLEFTLGFAAGLREATEALVLGERARGGVRAMPHLRMMQYPIWTTWAKYRDKVTQADVEAFAAEIVARRLPRSVMEVDDRWSVKYGDLEFDAAKFPHPKAMCDKLHAMGFLVTLWIIPFANIDSEAVTAPATRRFFVKTQGGDVGEFNWWQPTRVAALDVTNPEACAWFLGRLKRLQSEYGVDGFKFDAGEPCFLPKQPVTHVPLATPADYTRAWVNGIAGKFPVSEVRAGVPGTESAAPMLRMFDRFSTWGTDNGLASVITALLSASVLGYPFVLPDMIGGNAYDDDQPTGELMIRWAQATSAMPAMQFSIPAWDYGQEADDLCTAALRWRETVFWPAISFLVRDAADKYLPISRPMWWADDQTETDVDVLNIGDQFMVGTDLVVAPVVVEGARTREKVWLPSGKWRRVVWEGREGLVDGVASVEGPVWLKNIQAPLEEMPTWRRVGTE